MWSKMKTIGNVMSALFGLYLIYAVGTEVGARREHEKLNRGKRIKKEGDKLVVDLHDIL